jgi:hypothetical protein
LEEPAVHDLDGLLHGVFGWDGVTSVAERPVLWPTITRTYAIAGSDVRLVLREAETTLRGGADDHIGIAVTPDELANLGDRCSRTTGIETLYLENGVPSSVDTGGTVFRTFFVRHPLLALWFQFECHGPS